VDKPVVVVIGDLGASGAYYISMAADWIVANPNSLVGSIGVISEFPNAEELLEKVGVDFVVITSGPRKDFGSPYRELTDDERAYWQVIIDETYDSFVQIVAEGRGLAAEEVRPLGFKAYASLGGRVNFLIALYHSETGELLAMLEGDWLGRMRTGAASGVATKYMARPDAKTLGLFGSGGQARTQVLAVCAVRPIEKVLVYSRDPQKRSAFVADMQPQVKAQIVAVDSPTAAIENADVIVTATTAVEPILKREWIAPGAHINAVGSSIPTTREVDTATMAAASLFVDRRESTLNESGDVLFAMHEGAIGPDHIRAEVGEVLIGAKPGRASEDEITLFKSLGLAVEDLASAEYVYRKGKQLGVGTWVEF
jgi:ornithine cyclodeaminase/alanine dehydrogenase-like protein (mu-crystallin family)